MQQDEVVTERNVTYEQRQIAMNIIHDIKTHWGEPRCFHTMCSQLFVCLFVCPESYYYLCLNVQILSAPF